MNWHYWYDHYHISRQSPILILFALLIATQLCSAQKLSFNAMPSEVSDWAGWASFADNPITLHLHTDNSLMMGVTGQGFFRYTEESGWTLPSYGPAMRRGFCTPIDFSSAPDGSYLIAALLSPEIISHTNSPMIAASYDNGLTWVRADTGLVRPYWDQSKAIAIDPFHPDTVLWGGAHNLMQRSTNRGHTWTWLMGDSVFSQIEDITWSKTDEGLLFVGTTRKNTEYPINFGILRSTDSGETYNQVWPTDEDYHRSNVMRIVQDPMQSNTWYAGLQNFSYDLAPLWKSTDNGLTWHPLSEGLEIVTTINDITPDPIIENRIYLSTQISGLFRSDDGGLTWVEDMEGIQRYNSYLGAVGDTSTETIFVAGGGTHIYRRVGASMDWTAIDSNPFDSPPLGQLVLMNYHLYFINGGLGLYKSPLGEDWNPVQVGSQIVEDPVRCFALDQGNYRNKAIAVGSEFPFGISNRAVYVTKDGGNSWEEWGDQVVVNSMKWINQDTLLVEDGSGGKFRLLTADGVEDLSNTISSVLDWVLEGDTCVALIGAEVKRSFDRGRNWHSVRTPPPTVLTRIDGDPGSDGFMLGATNNFDYGIFYSNDGGNTWHEDETLDALQCVDVAIYENFAYVSSINRESVFCKIGDGSWEPCNEGLPEGFQPTILSAGVGGVVVTGNALPGDPSLFYMPHPGTDVENEWQEMPESMHLWDPYPNPGNASISIRYRVPANGSTMLRIVDVLGRTVTVLENSSVQAGEHIIAWDVSDVSSGTYYVTLTQNGNTRNRAITVLK